jgi:hypothetical protein
MHAGGGTNDRGEKRNVLIVSVLLLTGSNLTLRSNTQRRIQIQKLVCVREKVSFIDENTPRAPYRTKKHLETG